MRIVSAALIGLLFGIGILISGMGNPAKIMNFFDIAGTWDPSLALVMAGAVIVTSVGYRLALARRAPVLAETFNVPTATVVDMRLIAGAAVFGVGWGLSGFCPGGAIPMLATGHSEPIIFLIGLLSGLFGARQFVVHQAARAASAVQRV
jgi:uncharacterized membrane protein YedE/YeeE